MKKAFIAAAFLVAIIVIRMVLSVTLSEQIAEVFCKAAISFLFFYSICTLSKNKLKTVK